MQISSMPAFDLAIQLMRCGHNINMAYALILHVPMKFSLEFTLDMMSILEFETGKQGSLAGSYISTGEPLPSGWTKALATA